MAAVKDISTLISNARSRAAILSSLDNAFEVPLSGVRKKPLNEVELSTRIHNDRDAFIDHLQELLRGAGIYSRQKIEDQIKGKTIVLQHMRSGSTNAMAKLKKAHKGIRRSSNADLKKSGQLSVTSVSREDVGALRGLFSGYMKQFCSGCKNSGQLQARLLSCELTGATVAVVESIDRGMQQYLGRRGTVVGESMNCLSVAFEAIESDRERKKKKRGRKRRRREPTGVKRVDAVSSASEQESQQESQPDTLTLPLVVVTVIKEQCTLALCIDSSFVSFMGGGSGRSHSAKRTHHAGQDDADLVMCTIQGKHYLPSLLGNFHSLS